jgi:hypothetical protein
VRVRLPNNLLHLFSVGYIERQGKASVAEAFREIGNVD